MKTNFNEMEKQIIIRVHDITNDKHMGYFEGLNFHGMELICTDIKKAATFTNRDEASLLAYPDGFSTRIGRQDYTQTYFHEEVESEVLPEIASTSISQLLDDYKRRLVTVNEELKKLGKEADDVDKHKRLNTKASCYRTFITELERVIAN
jgi:hypothetical protein